ncbi:glutathione exchanger 1 [[Candida] railenensis]|uniref:Glutathione exchanger 1 n=1 Tax=[Candida] railenensis TaxID=45579 RepID=A0A9P0QLC6_9ASCO|nr:glutathione exchanger 1 [[Candida] railenensis]
MVESVTQSVEKNSTTGINSVEPTISNEKVDNKSIGSNEIAPSTSETTEEDLSRQEVYKRAWSRKVLSIGYFVLVFTAFVETFAGDSTSGLDSYATSEFNAASLISTAAVVYKITAIVSYPIMAKLNDLFGRAEGFGFSVLLYCLAYVLYSSCQNVQTYVCAEIFYAIGRIGYRVFQQVFIADTTSLINRGFWSSFPDAIAAVPALYVGTVIQDAFIEHSTWRWGYGVWAIIMGVSCILLTSFMFYLDNKANQVIEEQAQLHDPERKVASENDEPIKRSSYRNHWKHVKSLQGLPEGSFWKKARYYIFVRLDLFGGLLMLASFTLFFIPLTLTGTSSPYKWHEAKLIVMLVIGFVLFFVFLYWNGKVAKIPFVQHQSLNEKTILFACIIMACDWCTNSSYSTYMKVTLQVAKYITVGEATRIDDSKKACLQIFGIVGGVLLKYTKKTKIFILLNIPFYFLAHALLVHFMNQENGKMAPKGLLYMAEVFIGVSRGIYQCSLQVIVQAVGGQQGIAMSTAFFLAFSSIGSLIGSCISGGVWNTVALSKLKDYLPEDDKKNATKIYKSLTVALKYKKGTEARTAIAKAYRETQQLIGWIGLGILVPMLVLMWFIKDVKLTDDMDAYGPNSKENKTETESESLSEVAKNPQDKVSFITTLRNKVFS